MITHGNILSNLIPVHNEIQRLKHYAVPFGQFGFVHLIPLSHLFGQIMGLFIPQILKARVIFAEPAAPNVVRTVNKNIVHPRSFVFPGSFRFCANTWSLVSAFGIRKNAGWHSGCLFKVVALQTRTS